MLSVSGADKLTVYLAAATGFRRFDTKPDSDAAEPTGVCQVTLDKAVSLGYEQVKRRHEQDHRGLFGPR